MVSFGKAQEMGHWAPSAHVASRLPFFPPPSSCLSSAVEVGNTSKAVENVLSVLLFYPEDETAKKALHQYQTELGEPRPSLGPREDIQRFILRSLGEKRQLYYAMEHLGTSFKDPDSWTPAALIPEALREKLRIKRRGPGTRSLHSQRPCLTGRMSFSWRV